MTYDQWEINDRGMCIYSSPTFSTASVLTIVSTFKRIIIKIAFLSESPLATINCSVQLVCANIF